MQTESKPHHEHFYKIRAASHYDCGHQLGVLFGADLKIQIAKAAFTTAQREWAAGVLEATNKSFPQYCDELRGYASGAGVSFDDLWLLSLEDELPEADDKCTSIVTRDANTRTSWVIGHNEDWDAESADRIVILQKTIADLTTLELYYLHTLGGNAISVNSSGFVQAINTLRHPHNNTGVPKNVICRFTADTRSMETTLDTLQKTQRISGYNHNIVSLTDSKSWNVESNASDFVSKPMAAPLVHTNHFLCSELRSFEKQPPESSTWNRYTRSSEQLPSLFGTDNVRHLLRNDSDGVNLSVFNERTIASVLISSAKGSEASGSYVMEIWLAREKEKGWLPYDLAFIQ